MTLTDVVDVANKSKPFAKLHDANITQPTFLRISIGYRCLAESTTRLPSSVIKPSNCNKLHILLVYSSLVIQTVAHSEVIYVRPTVYTVFIDKHGCLSVRRFSCFAPTVWNSLPSFVHTADSFTSFTTQLKTDFTVLNLYCIKGALALFVLVSFSGYVC